MSFLIGALLKFGADMGGLMSRQHPRPLFVAQQNPRLQAKKWAELWVWVI
jgi:hypothetical protein